ncbi:hypothetical protein H6P81_016731 [Aristolochia fimbriata]|uniref:Uncharacterized protein n=1 Tax=Aristolochia fimbriata TaxID=158543 RepID=A0AAV7EC23_ARIFI|nr:hypothetical protein H6P81_016731 [Aristolochia fimbriata]
MKTGLVSDAGLAVLLIIGKKEMALTGRHKEVLRRQLSVFDVFLRQESGLVKRIRVCPTLKTRKKMSSSNYSGSLRYWCNCHGKDNKIGVHVYKKDRDEVFRGAFPVSTLLALEPKCITSQKRVRMTRVYILSKD